MLGGFIMKKKTQRQTTKGHEETFGGDEYVCYIDCGEDYIGVCLCPNSSICALKYVQFCIIILS